MSRRIRLDVEVQELDEGSYQPVDLIRTESSSCGGVFHLRAGMSRRILGHNSKYSKFATTINALLFHF